MATKQDIHTWPLTATVGTIYTISNNIFTNLLRKTTGKDSFVYHVTKGKTNFLTVLSHLKKQKKLMQLQMTLFQLKEHFFTFCTIYFHAKKKVG